MFIYPLHLRIFLFVVLSVVCSFAPGWLAGTPTASHANCCTACSRAVLVWCRIENAGERTYLSCPLT